MLQISICITTCETIVIKIITTYIVVSESKVTDGD